MYVYKRQAAAYQGIATLLALALVLWAVGSHMFTTAEAANLTFVKNTLSNSAPGEVSDHEFEFLSPTGVGNSETITITFPSQFTGTSSIAFGDVDLEVGGVDEVIVNGAPAAGQWGFSWTADVMTLTAAADESIGSNATVTVKIGTNANGGTNQITNPVATTSYNFAITAGASDSGNTRVAIIDDVLVTADIDTTFAFTVSGTTTGITINGASEGTFAPSTNTTLPFATLGANDPKILAQDLTVATNAIHGYVVTVEQDQQLESSTGADIDGFVDGSWTDAPTTWASPTNSIVDEDTWGHWGLTTTDTVTGRSGGEFGSNEWIAASTTPTTIMGHTGPADGVTDGTGRASVAYQIEITALQEAGDDYTTTLTYIATPTF